MAQRFKTIKAARIIQPRRVRLADFKYVGDQVIATYAQDESAILQANYQARQAEDVRSRIADLDMGIKFASVSRVRWLEIQKLGIENDANAIINYLNIVKAQEGIDYFTTNRRLG